MKTGLLLFRAFPAEQRPGQTSGCFFDLTPATQASAMPEARDTQALAKAEVMEDGWIKRSLKPKDWRDSRRNQIYRRDSTVSTMGCAATAGLRQRSGRANALRTLRDCVVHFAKRDYGPRLPGAAW